MVRDSTRIPRGVRAQPPAGLLRASPTTLLPTWNRLGLPLETVRLPRPVQFGLAEGCRNSEQHELSRLVHLGAQIDRHTAEVRHLQRDLTVEPRIDLGSRHVNRHPESSPAAPSLDESHEVVRNPDLLECLCENELSPDSNGTGLARNAARGLQNPTTTGRRRQPEDIAVVP